jgi:hypothetical protein
MKQQIEIGLAPLNNLFLEPSVSLESTKDKKNAHIIFQ